MIAGANRYFVVRAMFAQTAVETEAPPPPRSLSPDVLESNWQTHFFLAAGDTVAIPRDVFSAQVQSALTATDGPFLSVRERLISNEIEDAMIAAAPDYGGYRTRIKTLVKCIQNEATTPRHRLLLYDAAARGELPDWIAKRLVSGHNTRINSMFVDILKGFLPNDGTGSPLHVVFVARVRKIFESAQDQVSTERDRILTRETEDSLVNAMRTGSQGGYRTRMKSLIKAIIDHVPDPSSRLMLYGDAVRGELPEWMRTRLRSGYNRRINQRFIDALKLFVTKNIGF